MYSNVAREGDWEAEAACKGAPIEDFFRDKSDVPDTIKKLCKGCPVQRECLEAAMKEEGGSKIRFGYRGGKSAQARKGLYISRKRLERITAAAKARRADSESTYR